MPLHGGAFGVGNASELEKMEVLFAHSFIIRP
jgi:hypothetical protein